MRAAIRALSIVPALLAPLLATAAGASAGTLRVTVTPEALRLSDGSRAVVRVAGAADAPSVSASAGRVEGLHEVASGVYEAEYVPPDDVEPLVAVITASAPSAFGWVALPLAGVREVTVRAPHRTLVTVTVAGEAFGPVPAGVAGKAVVRVAVPPGVTFATYGRTRIALDVPRTLPSHVAPYPTSIDANEGGAVTVRAFALDERGLPLPRARVRLSASEGRISAPAEVAPGVVEARWELPPSKVRDAVVTAEIAGRPAARAVVRRVAGPPARVEVAGDRATVVAGEDELAVTGRVLDAAGNPTDAPARLVVSLGTGDAARVLPDAVVEWSGSGGVYGGRVLVPRGRAGRQELELRMIAGGARTLVATATIALLPGAPNQLRVEPESDLLADGHARDLRVTVLDQHGNRVDPPASPVLTAIRGRVGPAARERAGVYRASYRPPLTSNDFSDVISTRVGAVEGRTEVRVRARGGAVVLGAKAGFTASTGELRSPDVGAELGLWTRSLGMSLGLVLEGRYFTYARTERVGEVDVKTRGTFAAVEASGAWRRPFAYGMAWLGAGGGIVNASATTEVTGQAKVGAQSWIPSAHASAGWGFPVGPGIPFAEAKLTAQAAPDSGPLRGSLTSLTLSLGYRFDVL